MRKGSNDAEIEGRREKKKTMKKEKEEKGQRGEKKKCPIRAPFSSPHPTALTPQTRFPLSAGFSLPVTQQRASVASGSHKIFIVLLPALLCLSLPF